MNSYGAMAHDFEREYRPSRFEEMLDPETHFAELGERIATRVAELTMQLESQSPPTADFLTSVGARNSARARAENVVLTELIYSEPVEVGREEWEADQPSEDQLVAWADHASSDPDHPWPADAVQAKADELMLPVEFLEEMLRAPLPSRFLDANLPAWKASIEARFLVFLAEGRTSAL